MDVIVTLINEEKKQELIVSENLISLDVVDYNNIEEILNDPCNYKSLSIIVENEETLKNAIEKKHYITEININSFSKNQIELINKYSSSINKIKFGNLNLYEVNSIINSSLINENTLIKTKYNENEFCTIKEFQEASEYIYNIRDYVMQFNFTNLEKSIFIYDLLRERQYKESGYIPKLDNDNIKDEEVVDKLADSRSLTRVYKSDEIVCAGFSKIYMAVLESLDIPCEELVFYSNNDDNGHASNLVYIKDDTYNENCIVEIDTTWGRYEDEDGCYRYDKSLFNYSMFAKSILRSIEEMKNMGMDSTSATYSLVEKIYASTERLKKYKELNPPALILKGIYVQILQRLCNLKDKYDCSVFDEEIKELKEAISKYENTDNADKAVEKVLDKMKYTINPRHFFKALVNVKWVEYNIDNSKYPFNGDKIIKAYTTRFKEENIRDIMLVYRIFGSISDAISYDVDHLKDLELNINPITCVKK